MSVDDPRSSGVAGRIARAFIDSKLTPLIVVAAVLLGVAAIVLLPREEEPQIKVPMIDVMVNMAGFSAKEVEERATRPMEKLLWEIARQREPRHRPFQSRFQSRAVSRAADGKTALELRPHSAWRGHAADQAEVHR
jgi:hypothetical protein